MFGLVTWTERMLLAISAAANNKLFSRIILPMISLTD